MPNLLTFSAVSYLSTLHTRSTGAKKKEEMAGKEVAGSYLSMKVRKIARLSTYHQRPRPFAVLLNAHVSTDLRSTVLVYKNLHTLSNF